MALPFRAHEAWPAHVFGDVWESISESQVVHALGEACRSAPDLSARYLEEVALPLTGWVATRASAGQLTIALSGPPGTGKSTLARVLGLLLSRLFGLRSGGFSLDDVYRTKAERTELAERVHPLLMTRGVPGTHDLELAHRLIDELERASPEQPMWLPRFDKLADDRAPRDQWERVAERVDVLLLDGWFWGTLPGSEASLEVPVNSREATEDADGRWRRWVRAELAGPYQALFARANAHIQLTSPSWQTTVDWRLTQQLALLGSAGPPSQELRAKNAHFLHLFERILRLPSNAPALVLALDERHDLERVEGSALR